MARLVSFLVAALMAFLVHGQEAPTRGHLVLIGGGEKPREALQKFVELAGGPQALIVAIPTASTEPDTGEYYVKLFREEYACTNVVALPIRSPAEARRPELVEVVEKAGGIFFGGGDQVRILTALWHSPVLAAITAAHARGAVVGGTSAGTACQSTPMITGEGDFSLIATRTVELWDGLGLTPGMVVDQHFVARQRENRLLSVILEHPGYLGVGVDEDTAIWVRPDRTFQVMGERCVMVLDASQAVVTTQPRDTGQDRLGARNLRVHILLPGESFDIASRVVVDREAARVGTTAGRNP